MKKHLTKGLITALLVAVLMAVFAVSASAATTVTSETALNAAITDGAEIIVDGEITVTGTITIPTGTTVTIKGTNSAKLIAATSLSDGEAEAMINVSGTLILQDIIVDSNLWVNDALRSDFLNNTTSFRGINVNENAFCTLNTGAVIQGGYALQGGGIYNAGTLTLDGGKILNNRAGTCTVGENSSSKTYEKGDGGGVYNIGTFTMSSGIIGGNGFIGDATINKGGCGVYNASGATFNLNGGIIGIYNGEGKENYRAAGVRNDGTMIMTNGYISGNTTGGWTGGGVRSYGSFTMSGGEISNQTSTANGAGVSIQGGTFTMEGNAQIKHNTITGSSKSGAGLYINGSGIEVTIKGNASINNNKNTGTSGNAGGIYVYGSQNAQTTVTIKENATVYSNEAVIQGGGIRLGNDAILNVQGNAKIYSNILTGTTDQNYNGGGGIHTYGSRSQINISENAEIYSNSAKIGGGGVHVSAGVFTMTGGHIYKNTTEASGGGVRLSCAGPHNISGGIIGGYDANLDDPATEDIDEGDLGNSANGAGGGIYIYSGALNLSGTAEISYNKAASSGGGICDVSSAVTTISGGTIKNNTSGTFGGGVYNDYGTLYLDGGTITANIANIRGGGIYNKNTISRTTDVTGTKVTISNNRIGEEGDTAMTVVSSGTRYERCGGGVENISGSTFTMSNIEISGNYCPYYGGGIDNRGTMTLTNSTVSGNTTAGSGAGIFNYNIMTLDGVAVTGNITDTGVGAGVQTFSNSSFNSQITIKGATQITGNIGTGGSGINVNNNKDGTTIPVIFETGAIVIDNNYVKTEDDPDGTLGLTESNMRFAKDFVTTTINVTGDLTGSNIVLDLEALALDAGYERTLQIGTAGESAVLAGTITNTKLGTATAVEGKIVFADADTVTVKFVDIDGTTIQEIEIADLGAFWLPGADVLATTAGKFVGVVDTSVGGAFYTADEIEDDIIVTSAEIDGKTLTAVTLDVVTETGASVKLGETSGLRFFTKVDTATLGKLVDLGFTYQRGIKLGKTSDARTSNLIDAEALNAKTFDTWKGSQYYNEVDNNGMTYNALNSGYNAYSVALNMTSGYNQDYYFNGYIVLTLDDESYTVESDFSETEHCRSAQYVANAYGEYLKTNGTWNENTYEGLTAEQYESLCTVAGTTFAPDAAE